MDYQLLCTICSRLRQWDGNNDYGSCVSRCFQNYFRSFHFEFWMIEKLQFQIELHARLTKRKLFQTILGRGDIWINHFFVVNNLDLIRLNPHSIPSTKVATRHHFVNIFFVSSLIACEHVIKRYIEQGKSRTLNLLLGFIFQISSLTLFFLQYMWNNHSSFEWCLFICTYDVAFLRQFFSVTFAFHCAAHFEEHLLLLTTKTTKYKYWTHTHTRARTPTSTREMKSGIGWNETD